MKILQGFQEEQQNQVAILLASPTSVKKKKITRSYVTRVLMGPGDTFTPAKIQDEVNADDEIFVWGVLVEQHNMLNVQQFATDMSLLPPGSDRELLIGRVSPEFPTNLTKPEQWTVKNFLNFGDVEVSVVTKGKYATLRGGFRYLPDDERGVKRSASEWEGMAISSASKRIATSRGVCEEVLDVAKGKLETGQAKKHRLQDGMEGKYTEIAEAQSRIDQVEAFSQKLFLLPELSAMQKISATDLSVKVDVPPDHSFVGADFFKVLAQNVAKDAELKAPDEDCMTVEFPATEFAKHVFFMLKEAREKLGKSELTLKRSQAKLEKLRDTEVRRMQRTEKAMKTRMGKLEGKERKLSKRNFVNRMRNMVKRPRKVREEDKAWSKEDLPKPVQRLTIFQKLEIVRYANQLWQDFQEKHERDNPSDDETEMAPRSKKRKRGFGDEVRRVIKGVNVQRACEIKFQNVIGKIKVCQLQKACRIQKWESLTEKQQKSLYHLPDSLKVSLGLSHLVKGWKSLDPASFQKLSDDNMAIKRWSVPGPVLKELNEAMTEFAEGKSLVCQRRDIVFARHCVVTVRRIARHYNKGLDDAIRRTDEFNTQTTQEMVAAGVSAKDIDKVLIPRPLPCPENLSVRWCRRFLRAYNWRKVSRNTAGNYLEWSDPRLMAARNGVHDKIKEHGVHRYLVLNIDQVWRQALRFSKTLFIKGKQRKKQQNHLIARSDFFPGSRLSITCLTSTWSDGSCGPLGLCIPESCGMQQEAIERFNLDHQGIAYIFSSGSHTHFMNGESFVDLLHGLLGHAFHLQRKRYGLSTHDKGLILADAWAGFHGKGTEASREAWSQQHAVFMPELQAGGFSANAQPVDQVHHLLRARLDYVDSDIVGCEADLSKRERYERMPIKANGQPERPKAFDETLPTRTLRAWLSVPNKAFIAAWISTGYFTAEHFPESDMSREDAMRVLDPTGMLVTMGIRSEQAAQPPLDPKRWYWAVKMGEEVALLPNIVALQVEKHITEHRRQRRILAEKKPAKWEEKLASINGKILSFVYNKKTCAMATSRFVKSKTAVIDGQTQVIGNTKAYEVINIKFELDIPGAPAGLGKYFLESQSFERKQLCCVSTSKQCGSGWDMLKEMYGGEDESDAECPQEEDEVEEEGENEEEEEENGMIAPDGVIPMHHEDGAMDDGHFSCCSSDGLQDMEDEDAGDPTVVEEAHASGVDGPPDPGLAASASNGGRIKAYHTSPEWVELKDIEQTEGIHLLRIPPIIGCGVNRHPSNNYWSCRFPGHPAKTASWSNGNASPKACLVLCLRHVIKLYLSSGPSDQDSYQKQLADLQKIGA